MKILGNIMIGLVAIAVLVGIGSGLAFFILVCMGFFEPLTEAL